MNIKKAIICIVWGITFLATGCTAPSDSLNTEINELREEINALKEEKENLEKEIIAEKIEKGDAIYVVTINISQSHMFGEIKDIIKDSINDIEIDIPVSEEFYNTVEIGTILDNSFRMGSFIMSGSIGNWEVKIVDKKIQ